MLKAYILTGYDVTSKRGTKASAVASKPETYLDDFGIELLWDSSLVCANKRLVRVISFKSSCEIFYNLKYEICKKKEKALNELPPTSSTIHGHLLKSHYFVYLCSNLLDSCSKILWMDLRKLAVTSKQEFCHRTIYLTTKWHCKKGCTRNCGCKRALEKCTEYCNCTNCENR